MRIKVFTGFSDRHMDDAAADAERKLSRFIDEEMPRIELFTTSASIATNGDDRSNEYYFAITIGYCPYREG